RAARPHSGPPAGDGAAPGKRALPETPAEPRKTDPPAEAKVPEPEPVPPLPAEFADLMRQSAVTGADMHKQLKDYTYILKKTRRTLDERGQPMRSQEQVFEAYPVKGEHVLIRLSADGVPSRTLAEDRKRAVQQLQAAEARLVNETASVTGEPGDVKEADGYLSAGVSGVYNGKTGYVSINIAAFFQHC